MKFWATLLLPLSLLAQPAPRTKDGKVDLSGVWTSDPKTFADVGHVSLKPEAQKLYQQRSDSNPAKHDPVARCLPTGVPRITKEPFKIMQTPKTVLMMFEGGTHSFRQFFVGEEHSDETDPAWMGHSVAKWEGDTLIVDTANFNDLTWLNANGLPHGEQFHVIERYTRPSRQKLSVAITMEDPEMFTKPAAFQRTHTLNATHELREYVCNEASLDAQHLIQIR